MFRFGYIYYTIYIFSRVTCSTVEFGYFSFDVPKRVICCRQHHRRGRRVLEWREKLESVDRPSTRWADGLLEMARQNLMRKAQDRKEWCALKRPIVITGGITFKEEEVYHLQFQFKF